MSEQADTTARHLFLAVFQDDSSFQCLLLAYITFSQGFVGDAQTDFPSRIQLWIHFRHVLPLIKGPLNITIEWQELPLHSNYLSQN
jgi:hypothetical protein